MKDDEDFESRLTSQEGYRLGYDMASYDIVTVAQRAFDMGEIELWLNYHKPKSMADWDLFEAENGPMEEYEKRWK